MSLIRRAWQHWHSFWFGPADARALALVRVGLGLSLLRYMVHLLPVLENFVSDAGMLPHAALLEGRAASLVLFEWSTTRLGLLAAVSLLCLALGLRLLLPSRESRVERREKGADSQLSTLNVQLLPRLLDGLAGAAVWFIAFGALEGMPRIWLLYALAVLAMLLVTAGLLTQPALAFSYLWMAWFRSRAVAVAHGWDGLLVVALFVLMWTPCDRALSLSAALQRKRGPALSCRNGPKGASQQNSPSSFSASLNSPPTVPAWALRVLGIQLSVMYLSTAWQKFPDPYWRDGSFMSYFMMSYHARFPSTIWAEPPFLVLSMLLSWGTLLIETFVPVLVWIPATRRLAMLAGIALHVGIALAAEVPVFGAIMITYYAAFLKREDFEIFGTWLARRRAKHGPSAARRSKGEEMRR